MERNEALLEDLTILLRVVLAMILGAAIGFERELANKPAGLRTHMFVAGAAALLVGLGEVVIAYFTVHNEWSSVTRADPIRIIQSVIIGVSFLGAGTIIRPRSGDDVEGLTTAASLLFVAVIGICAGLGKVLLAGGSAVLVVATVAGLKWVESWLAHRRQSQN